MKPRRPTIKDSTQHLNSEGRERKSQQVAARAARKAAKKARQEAEVALHHQFPRGFPLAEASFYSSWGVVSNVNVGSKNGHDYVVFDYDTNTGETAHTQTVLAIEAESPKTPTTSLSRASGLRLERTENWIFAFEPERRISPDKIDSLVDDVMKLLQYAQAFPQNA